MPPQADVTVEALALVQAQAASRQQLNDVIAASVAAQVRVFGGWYDTKAITELAQSLARVTRAGQRQMATSTSAYSSRVLKLLLAGRRPAPARRIDVTTTRPVPLESVYGRLADQYRYLAATRSPEAFQQPREPGAPVLEPLSPERILDRVVQRSQVQAEDSLSLAFRNQWAADLSATGARVTGYRRILHPELSNGGTCGLCIVGSDRVYYKTELLPLHGRCNCTVMPVVGDEHGEGDPGSAINQDDLQTLYEQAGSTKAADLKRTKYIVHDHPELGPQLRLAGDTFRGPRTVAADSTH